MHQWIILYGGAPCLSDQNLGWSDHPNTSWNASYTTLHTPQVQRSSLEETIAQLERGQAEFSSLRAEMDYSQVGLPRFLDQNEISQPPNGRITKLEATMVELESVCAKCATSQVQLMEVARANVQIHPMPF